MACAHVIGIAGLKRFLPALGAEPDLKRLRAMLAPSESNEDHPLTERQIEVLMAVASGKTNRQIAEELYVSEHTVRRHLQNIFNEIGVNSRAAATATGTGAANACRRK